MFVGTTHWVGLSLWVTIQKVRVRLLKNDDGERRLELVLGLFFGYQNGGRVGRKK